MLLKKQPAKLLAAFLLLMTFITGQLIVIAHTHGKAEYSSHQTKKDTNDDKCRICDQNSHLQLFYQQQQTLFTVAQVTINAYQEYHHLYYSVKLHQACNRGPPVI